MGTAQPATGLQETSEQRGGNRERWVSHDVKGLAGKSEICGIGLDDDHAVTEAGSEGAGSLRV